MGFLFSLSYMAFLILTPSQLISDLVPYVRHATPAIGSKLMVQIDEGAFLKLHASLYRT